MALTDEEYEKDRKDWNNAVANLTPQDIIPAIKLLIDEMSYLRARVRELEKPAPPVSNVGGEE